MSEEKKAVPVCWFEAEESARGGDPRELMWSMCNSTRVSKDKPATGNPVWPLYAIPEGYVLVPVDLMIRASESLTAFVSGEGWAQVDMDVMDNLDAFIIATKQGGAS